MPVDKENLKTTIREAVGDDNELYALLEQKLLANDATATQFLSGFMRNRDYTQKTQALATDRQTMDGQIQTYNGQIDQYRKLLDAAEADKQNVLKDLASQKMTVAQAHARLKHIKDTYNLSDDEIPAFGDLIDTKQRGKPVDSSEDLDKRFQSFREEMGKYIADKLVPELGGMAQLDIVWSDIRDEHRELTGKRLSAKEAQELLTEADKRGRNGRPISLKSLWEEKYDVSTLRMKHHDDELIKEHKAKWEADAQAKRSEEALSGVRPSVPGEGLRTSQIFEHKFKVHEEGPAAAPKPRESKSAAERQSQGGAERATRRYLERRSAGVPMGAPDERKSPSQAA